MVFKDKMFKWLENEKIPLITKTGDLVWASGPPPKTLNPARGRPVHANQP